MPQKDNTAAALLARLERLASRRNVEGQRRFGITPRTRHLGVSVARLRALARGIRDHRLAAALWASGIHEARILASMVDDPGRVTRAQMERWSRAFDSWDVCDQVCGNLFDRTAHAQALAVAWSRSRPTFRRRAGFALMACMARHRRDLADRAFVPFLAAVREASGDGRRYVSKGANWALREIGKRGPGLRRRAVAECRRIAATGTAPARWIASDALRELLRGPSLRKSVRHAPRRRFARKHGLF